MIAQSTLACCTPQNMWREHGTHSCHLPKGDLEDFKTVDNIANKVKGKVDILVNNAGMLDKESILQGAVTL